MKIHIVSDLHIDFCPFVLPKTDADVIVIAGDLKEHKKGYQGIQWLLAQPMHKPILYVQGNHEYYHGSIPHTTDGLRKRTQGTHVSILENDKTIIDDVVFLGCTLWTDFEIFGLNAKAHAAAMAQKCMNDYLLIRNSSEHYRRLQTTDTIAFHRRSRLWLEKELNNLNPKCKTVVVTHHAPSFQSLSEYYKTDILSAAFASNMEDMVTKSMANLWIHGHMHDSFDYTLGATRVVCNPRGYANIKDFANSRFNPRLILEI